MKDIIFCRDDIVRVSNPSLKTHNRVGMVLCSDGTSVKIQLAGLPILTYYSGNLTLVSRGKTSSKELNEIVKENNDMTVKGNYNVAIVNFLEGTNTITGYVFALFDTDIVSGDNVLVDTSRGYGVAKVNAVLTKDECVENGYSLPTKEVICKVDFTAFDNRIHKREKAAQLKKDMDKKVKALQEIAVFELLAEKSPELKDMLDEYKNLVEE